MASMSVLIIEHDTHYTERLSAVFDSHGAQVLIAEEGHQGMAMLDAQRPDLIVLAIELPTISGYSICKKLKRHNEYRQIPLFLISSTATAETFTQHSKLKTRAEEYFIKPFDAEDLWQHVEQYVELRSPEPDEPEIDTGEYDFDVPADDVPEDDVPEDDVPEDDVPEDDVPEDDVPEDDVPEDARGHDTDEHHFDEPFDLGSGHDSSFELIEENVEEQGFHDLKADMFPNHGVIAGRPFVSLDDDEQHSEGSPFEVALPQDVESTQATNDVQGPPNASAPLRESTSNDEGDSPPDMFKHLDRPGHAPPTAQRHDLDDALTSQSSAYSKKPSLHKPGSSYSDHHHSPFTSNTSVPIRAHSRDMPVRRISQDNIEITILTRKLERRQQDYDALRNEYDQLAHQLSELNIDHDSAARQALALKKTLTERERDLHEHQRRLEDAEITEQHLRASLQQTLDRCDELTILLDEATHRQEMFQRELNDARHAHKLTDERAQQKLHALNEELTKSRETLQTQQRQLLNNEQALKHLQSEQQRFEQQTQQERTRLRESQQHTHHLEEQLNESANLLQEARRQLDDQQQAWTQERAQLETQHLQLTQEHDALRQKHQALFEERQRLQRDLTQHQQEADTLQEALSAETSALNALQSDRERDRAERQSLQDRLDALQEHLNALQRRHDDEVQARHDLSTKLHVTTQERDALHQESDAAHARIELLQEQLEASSTRAEELQSHFERIHADHQMEAAQADAALEEFEDTQQTLQDRHNTLASQYADLQNAYAELKDAHRASLALQAPLKPDPTQQAELPPPAPQPPQLSDDTEEAIQSDFLEITDDDLGDLENNPESLQIASEVLDGLTSLDEGDERDEDIDVEPEDIDVEPEDIDVEPEDTDVEPEDIDVEPEDIDVEPEDDDLSIELDDIESEDDDLSIELDDLDDVDEMTMLDIVDEPMLSADEQLLIDDLNDEDVIVDDIVIEDQ